MKKKAIIIWTGIALLTAIAVVEIFDFHPSINIGQYQVRWAGVSHMRFTSVDGANMIKGRVGKITVHSFGPIIVFPIHDRSVA